MEGGQAVGGGVKCWKAEREDGNYDLIVEKEML